MNASHFAIGRAVALILAENDALEAEIFLGDLYINVAYGSDLDLALAVIEQVAKQMQQQDSLWGKYITAIKLKGVENFGDNSITIRLILHTEAAQQWDVGREYRLRLKSAFDQAGIEIPFPQHSIWFKNALITPNTAENSTASIRDKLR